MSLKSCQNVHLNNVYIKKTEKDCTLIIYIQSTIKLFMRIVSLLSVILITVYLKSLTFVMYPLYWNTSFNLWVWCLFLPLQCWYSHPSMLSLFLSSCCQLVKKKENDRTINTCQLTMSTLMYYVKIWVPGLWSHHSPQRHTKLSTAEWGVLIITYTPRAYKWMLGWRRGSWNGQQLQQCQHSFHVSVVVVSIAAKEWAAHSSLKGSVLHFGKYAYLLSYKSQMRRLIPFLYLYDLYEQLLRFTLNTLYTLYL